MNFRTVWGEGVSFFIADSVFVLYMFFFSLIFGKKFDYVVSLTGTVAQIKLSME